jgi:DNA-binding IclR family transcriptional regulator
MSLLRIGNIAPCMHRRGHAAAHGYSGAQLTAIPSRGWRAYENTITTRIGARARAEQVRRQGFAFDNEECEQGARCVGRADSRLYKARTWRASA